MNITVQKTGRTTLDYPTFTVRKASASIDIDEDGNRDLCIDRMRAVVAADEESTVDGVTLTAMQVAKHVRTLARVTVRKEARRQAKLDDAMPDGESEP